MNTATAITTATDPLAPVLADVDPESALALRTSFGELFARAAEWRARASEIRVTSPDQRREMKLARESRLALREIRVRADHERKRLKESIVRRGRAIDGAFAVLRDQVEPIEAYLLEQETFAERHERDRKSALGAARAEALSALGADPSAFVDLGEMSEETWASTLADAKDARAARLAREEEERAIRLEAERIAAEKREAAKAAAAKAAAERLEREKAQEAELARVRAEQEQERAKAAAERAEADRVLAAERAAAEEATRQARAEKERAERELAAERARVEAERRAEEERQAAAAAEARAAELAPDREKLAAFAATIRALPRPELTSADGLVARAKLDDQIARFAAWVEKVGAAL